MKDKLKSIIYILGKHKERKEKDLKMEKGKRFETL